MPPRKEVTPCPGTVAGKLGRLLACYTSSREALLRQHRLYCRSSGTAVILHAARLATPPPRTDETVVALGVQVAIVNERGQVLPSLGLLSLIRRYASLENHYAVVDEKAARLYTYGRDVFRGSVLELRTNPGCRDAPVAVLSPRREPLGFGRPQPRGRVLIRNLIDVGWYLRSGL